MDNTTDNSMAELNAVLQALGNPIPPKPDSQGFIKDDKGASIVMEDPILTSTPEPRPVPHAPPSPNQPFPRIQQPPSVPVEQSNITSRPIKSEPTVQKPPQLKRLDETKIFFTGRSGAGKTYLTNLLRHNFPHITVVDGIDSARDFKALQDAGFVNYHVACSPMTLEARPKRPPGPQPLADTLDASVKLSLMKGGSNTQLHCIWNDPSKIRANERLMTLEEFFEQYTP